MTFMHITIDMNGCNVKKLKNIDVHYELLTKLPHLIGMNQIQQTCVFPYTGLEQGNKGITGIVIVDESHISIHSFEEREYCFVDIFSRTIFNKEEAIDTILNTFEPKSHNINFLNRFC